MSCLNMALDMARAGKSIIPIQPRGKKPAWQVLPVITDERGEPILSDAGKTQVGWEAFKTRIATEDEIHGWFEKMPDLNIGLVCGAVSGMVAVDVDGEAGQAWFRANMPKPNLFQYTSNKSKFHAFYAHPGRRVAPAVGIAPEVDVRGDGSYVVFAPSIHPSGATYTLHYLSGFAGWDSLAPCPDLARLKPEITRDDQQGEHGSVDLGTRNATLASVVGRILAKGMSRDDALFFALGWNESNCNPPLSRKEVERTVDSVHKTHAVNNPLAINADGIRKWIQAIPGQFRVADLDAEMGIKDQDGKLQRTATLEALCREGVIERVGQVRGTYRIRDRKMTILDVDAEEEPEVDMWLPFGLNRNVKIQQKNIIVVAGETNSGKTSLLMNMAWMQAARGNVRYLCSEMTGPELKSKTASFGHVERWKNCEFVERTNCFHDVILPDGITFIDYLEVYDNFFRIGEDIRAIYDALKTGVAVIALQKTTGSDLGRGGAFTIEKARLALSLFAHGRLLDGIIGSAKLMKAKNIRGGFNPEGRELFYTLRGGYYFDAGNMPNVYELERGWRFYDKKTREKVGKRIETYCKEQEVNEEMHNVEFYS